MASNRKDQSLNEYIPNTGGGGEKKKNHNTTKHQKPKQTKTLIPPFLPSDPKAKKSLTQTQAI